MLVFAENIVCTILIIFYNYNSMYYLLITINRFCVNIDLP